MENMTGSTHPKRVGLAVSHTFASYRRILHGIRQYAAQHPEWVFSSLVPQAGGHSRDALREFDGAIASINTAELVRLFHRWPKPLVNVAAIWPDLPFPRVGVDNRAVGAMVAEYLLNQGLKNFAFAGRRDLVFSIERERGFAEALEAAGTTFAAYHSHCRKTFDALGRIWPLDRGVDTWLRRLPRPVGILAANDHWGAQLCQCCRRLGLRVPDDVAVVGVGNDDAACDLCDPPLSSVLIPAEGIGVAAADLVRQLIEGAAAPADPVLRPPLGIEVRRSSDVLAIEDRDVVAAIRFIRENAHRPIQVKDILDRIAVGRRSLERRTKHYLGHSLGDEILRIRLDRAVKLLSQTNFPISKIAELCGFRDFRYFAVVFRARLGQTPSKFRAARRSR